MTQGGLEFGPVQSRSLTARSPAALDAPRAPGPTLCAKLAAYFRAHPGEWIDGRVLGTIAGAYAWR